MKALFLGSTTGSVRREKVYSTILFIYKDLNVSFGAVSNVEHSDGGAESRRCVTTTRRDR